MGKTTNALEKVAEAFFTGNKESALALFNTIKNEHLSIVSQLNLLTVASLSDLFTEVEWLLHDNPVREYDYYYDQIVCCGELLSTAIISNYFNTQKIQNTWIDVRDIFRTDDNFRDANIDWEFTQQKVQKEILPLFKENSIIITQGFIGST
ncbi:MAG: aspartate kinase, partial [Sphingobacteriales bacterium]|nr:aspartate kinase [Sphingobacteriales bacterium]